MKEQYVRTELLIGAEGLEILRRSRVALFGLGGVGGSVLEALVRAGIGSFELIDADTVSVSNLNRQILATAGTVGMEKTEAARRRLLSIDPDTDDMLYDLNGGGVPDARIHIEERFDNEGNWIGMTAALSSEPDAVSCTLLVWAHPPPKNRNSKTKMPNMMAQTLMT